MQVPREGPGAKPGRGERGMSLKRPTWSAVGRAVMVGLGFATEVIELIRAVHGGL